MLFAWGHTDDLPVTVLPLSMGNGSWANMAPSDPPETLTSALPWLLESYSRRGCLEANSELAGDSVVEEDTTDEQEGT